MNVSQRRVRLNIVLDDRSRRAVLAALAGVSQRGMGILATFLLFPKVLHAIGPTSFGMWAAATSLIALIVIADFGVGPAIMTLLPQALASGDERRPREYFTAAMTMAMAIAVGVGAVGGAVALALAPRTELDLYLLAIGGVALNVPLGIANPTWMALQRGWMVAFWDFIQTLLFVTSLTLAIHFTTDLRLFVAAAYGSLLTANALNLGWLLATRPEIRPRGGDAIAAATGKMLGTGIRYFALTGLDTMSYILDTVLTLQLLGAVASSRMAVIQKICIASLGLITVLIQPLWPAFADAAVRNDRRWLFRAVAHASAVVGAAALAGSGLLVVFGLPFLRFWLKSDIGIGQNMLWVIAAWIVSLSLVRVQIMLLNALQIVHFQIAVFAVATSLAVLLKFLLAPEFGVAGILMATAMTFPLIIFPAVLWRARQWRRQLDETVPGHEGAG